MTTEKKSFWDSIGTGAKEISSDVILKAFEVLGGDPISAIQTAKGYTSTTTWIASQSAKTAGAGAVAMAIPVVHLPALVADICYLLHQMAYCSWGIGELRKCIVLGKPDFANILALWSGAVTLNELPYPAISKAAFEMTLTNGSNTLEKITLTQTLAQMSPEQLAMYDAKYGGGLLAQREKSVLAGASRAAIAAGSQVGISLAGPVAAQVAAKISAKLGAKAFAGFIPFIGPLAGAGINTYFVCSI